MMRRLITTVDHAVGKPVFHNSSLWEVRGDIRCNLFDYTDKEIRGLPWGQYYDKYHNNAYDRKAVNKRVSELMADPYVKNRSGVFAFILGGESNTFLLNVRMFDDGIKRAVYEAQTVQAKHDGVSNCPLCAVGHDANASRIWKLSEMDADHVTAWSKGGATDISNCQMLCKTHNRANGNKWPSSQPTASGHVDRRQRSNGGFRQA